MIICATYTEREDFRRVDDPHVDDWGRIEFIALEIRDLFRLPGIRSVVQRAGILGTQKNRLPYFVEHCDPLARAYSTARYCSISLEGSRRVSSCARI